MRLNINMISVNLNYWLQQIIMKPKLKILTNYFVLLKLFITDNTTNSYHGIFLLIPLMSH